MVGARRMGSAVGQKMRDVRRGVRVGAAHLIRPLMRNWTFVAITGSCGKTTSTALLAHLIDAPSPLLLTRGLNNAYGAARAILHLAFRKPSIAVFEVTGHAPGAVRATSQLIKPSVGIVTVVGLDHTSAFGQIEATADEKMTLVADLPADGLAVLNADDPRIMARSDLTAARVVTFGHVASATLQLHSIRDAWPLPLEMDVSWRGKRFTVESPLIGKQSVGVILASLLTALELGVERQQCLDRLKEFAPLMNRMSVHEVPDGRQFILDAWKAPHWALDTCLSFLETANAPRKTVVFGTLSDVRGNTRKRYEHTARRALEVADRVLFVGDESARVRRMKEPGIEGRLFRFDNVSAAHKFLSEDQVAGEVIYVKASRADHLERLMHASFTEIACWRYRCGKRFQGCSFCTHLLERPIRDATRASTLPWLTPQQKLPV